MQTIVKIDKFLFPFGTKLDQTNVHKFLNARVRKCVGAKFNKLGQ